MKRVLSIVLTIIICFSMVSCGQKSKKDAEAFGIAKQAYNSINRAYAQTCDVADDIYSAWQVAIYHKDSVGFDYLADNLSLSKEDLDEGIVYSIFTLANGSSYETASEKDKQEFRNSGDFFFITFKLS